MQYNSNKLIQNEKSIEKINREPSTFITVGFGDFSENKTTSCIRLLEMTLIYVYLLRTDNETNTGSIHVKLEDRGHEFSVKHPYATSGTLHISLFQQCTLEQVFHTEIIKRYVFDSFSTEWGKLIFP